MNQYINKADLVAKIRRRFDEYSTSILKHYDACKEAKAQELGKILTIIDTLEVKEEPVSEDLEKEYHEFLKREWFGKPGKTISEQMFFTAQYFAKWQKEKDDEEKVLTYKHGFEDCKEQMMKDIWKPAEGSDLPVSGREVIVLVQDDPDDKDYLRVAFANRPSKYTKVWYHDLGEEQVIEVERYGKGEWDIPNVKYWLDVKLPKAL